MPPDWNGYKDASTYGQWEIRWREITGTLWSNVRVVMRITNF